MSRKERATVGKVYRIKPSMRPAVCLPKHPLSDELVLCTWVQGILQVHPLEPRMGYDHEPQVRKLVRTWGLTLVQLDRILEVRLYAGHPDVLRVRADEHRKA